MAKRGNRPKDAEDTKGGVRGTHGLGDMPRERVKRSGQVALRTSNWDKNAPGPHHVDAPEHGDAPRPVDVQHHTDIEAGTGEEHEFQLSNAMGELESIDERAARREHDAAEAQAELDGEPVLDPEERKERNIASEIVPGPGPKDRHAGRATKQHLETHGLEDEAREPRKRSEGEAGGGRSKKS